MKRDVYSVNEKRPCKCGKGETTYKCTYSEPENPLFDHSPAVLQSSVKIATTCPDNCDNVSE